MATKAELEKEIKSLKRRLAALEKRIPKKKAAKKKRRRVRIAPVCDDRYPAGSSCQRGPICE